MLIIGWKDCCTVSQHSKIGGLSIYAQYWLVEVLCLDENWTKVHLLT